MVFWLAPWSDDVRPGKHVEFQQHFVWVDARRFCTRHYPRTQLTGDVAACRVGAHEILYYTRLPGIVIYRLNVMYRTTYLCRSKSDYNGACSTQYLHYNYALLSNSLVFTMFPNHKPSIRNTRSIQSILGSTAVFQVANALQQVLTEWSPMHRLLRNWKRTTL